MSPAKKVQYWFRHFDLAQSVGKLFYAFMAATFSAGFMYAQLKNDIEDLKEIGTMNHAQLEELRAYRDSRVRYQDSLNQQFLRYWEVKSFAMIDNTRFYRP